jgi:hypothetical protein
MVYGKIKADSVVYSTNGPDVQFDFKDIPSPTFIDSRIAASVGVTVQPYSASTCRTDVTQTWTSAQVFSQSQAYPAIPANTQSAAYTLVASDAGKHINTSSGGVTIPASVLPVGSAVSIYNNSGSSQTITQGNGVILRQAGTANTGNRTLAQYGLCSLLCVASNTFVISGAGLS